MSSFLVAHICVTWTDEAVVVGEDHGLYSIPKAEFVEEPFQVRFDRALADAQTLSDLGVRVPVANLDEHVQLARRKPLKIGEGGFR